MNENSGNYFDEILKFQGVWASLVLQAECCVQKQTSCDPMLFFVITGEVCIRVNSLEKYEVSAREMFILQSDSSYEMTAAEQSHLMVCYVPVEVWYSEQRQIDELLSKDTNEAEGFVKLPIDEVIFRYLLLLNTCIEDRMSPSSFFELKRQELFLLLFFYYSKDDLARFLQGIVCGSMQFKKFVVNNYLNVGNVRELAELANYSTSGFIKKFQRCFKESPYKWMQTQKAKQIFIEMNQGVKSLQEIANEYRFSSYQHFAAFCKAHWGLPPTEILNRNKVERDN